MSSVQSTLFDELEVVAEKPRHITSRSRTVSTKLIPEESYVYDIPTEEASDVVTVPCVDCGNEAHIRIHGKEFCMRHYESYFYRTEGVKFGEFEFI